VLISVLTPWAQRIYGPASSSPPPDTAAVASAGQVNSNTGVNTGVIGNNNVINNPAPERDFYKLAEELGVDVAALQSKDFRVEFTQNPMLKSAFGISFYAEPKVARLLAGSRPSIKFGDDDFVEAWTVGQPNQVLTRTLLELPAGKGVSIKFEPPYAATGKVLVIGPFAFDFDLQQEALKKFKQYALETNTRWGAVGEFAGARLDFHEFYPAVARARYGFAENRLDQVFEVSQQDPTHEWAKRPDVRSIKSSLERGTLNVKLPARGSDLFVELEFFDGSKSPVRRVGKG
jgi:hypothetical protein